MNMVSASETFESHIVFLLSVLLQEGAESGHSEERRQFLELMADPDNAETIDALPGDIRNEALKQYDAMNAFANLPDASQTPIPVHAAPVGRPPYAVFIPEDMPDEGC